MQPDGSGGGREGVHVLSQKTQDEAAEHVAEPAVARVGGALLLMMARPSGAAMTVSAPFNTITAPLRRAASRARDNLSPVASKMRLNSPSCGVMTQAPWMAWNSSAGRDANALMASASITTGLLVFSISKARWRVASLTPAPGPMENAV